MPTMFEMPANMPTAPEGFAVYTVTVETPAGEAVLDCPSMSGPELAVKRAVLAATSAGWGDIDECKATACTIMEGSW